MRLHKRTRYALYAVMELTRADDDHPVTAAYVSERYSIPSTVMAKVFQRLVRAGIAVGTRGLGGGYRLAAPPSRLTVLDVVEAFESPRGSGECLLDEDRPPACPDHAACDLRRLFDELDESIRCTFASVTLDTLVRRPRPDLRLRLSGMPR